MAEEEKNASDAHMRARMVELERQLAEAQVRADEQERRVEEERKAKEEERKGREEAQVRADEERAKREEQERRVEEERKGREAERKAKEEERKGREEERKAKEEAQVRADEQRAKREEQERRVEEERKKREEVNAAEFLDQPLAEATLNGEVEYPTLPAEATAAPTPKKSKTTSLSQKQKFSYFMPYTTRVWTTFETELKTFRAYAATQTVRRPMELQVKGTIFDDEKFFVLYWGNSREATLEVMKQLYPNRVLAGGKTSTSTKEPGCPDEFFTVFPVLGPRHVLVLEHKHPAVEFQTETVIPDILAEDEPTTRKTPKRYTLCTLVQTYTYLIQNKLKYGIFSNWNNWIFMKREIDEQGKEVLYVSPWIGRDRARLGWATLVHLACRDMGDKECQPKDGKFGTVPSWIRTPRTTEPAMDGGAGDGSNPASGGGEASSSNHTGIVHGGQTHRIEVYPETTTLDALGVTALSLLESFQVLGHTEKSHTRRVQVKGKDLVVKLVDYLGVPKHTDYSARDLDELEWNEARIYQYLLDHGAQGRVAPHYLYHGSDFNQIWATAVTTYEGESLARMVEDHGNLSREIQTAAVVALQELHDLGVLHGDIALRNAIWRPSDGRVIWVDYELAQLQTDCPEFAARSVQEIRDLEALFQETLQDTPPPPVSSPSPLSPPSLPSASAIEKEPTVKRERRKRHKICPCM